MSLETKYITTPIYYVNDRPHIGHVYTTTICDVWARFQRLAGQDVFFLTGTDEHGQKVEQSAEARGVTPQALAVENSAEFRRIMGLFNLTNDEFIRTTDPRHERQVQAVVKRLMDSGDVYLGTFEGWYDAGQEEYYTENKAREVEYRSPISGSPWNGRLRRTTTSASARTRIVWRRCSTPVRESSVPKRDGTRSSGGCGRD